MNAVVRINLGCKCKLTVTVFVFVLVLGNFVLSALVVVVSSVEANLKFTTTHARIPGKLQ